MPDEALQGNTPLFVYMTAGSLDEARRIGRALVEERLAACVNLIDGMRAIYRWQGTVQEGAELVMIAKTTASAFARMRARVIELHSYEVPCIVALPIPAGNPAFLGWIGEQVESAEGA